jgi:hypothetical protein
MGSDLRTPFNKNKKAKYPGPASVWGARKTAIFRPENVPLETGEMLRKNRYGLFSPTNGRTDSTEKVTKKLFFR